MAEVKEVLALRVKGIQKEYNQNEVTSSLDILCDVIVDEKELCEAKFHLDVTIKGNEYRVENAGEKVDLHCIATKMTKVTTVGKMTDHVASKINLLKGKEEVVFFRKDEPETVFVDCADIIDETGLFSRVKADGTTKHAVHLEAVVMSDGEIFKTRFDAFLIMNEEEYVICNSEEKALLQSMENPNVTKTAFIGALFRTIVKGIPETIVYKKVGVAYLTEYKEAKKETDLILRRIREYEPSEKYSQASDLKERQATLLVAQKALLMNQINQSLDKKDKEAFVILTSALKKLEEVAV